MDPQAFTQFRAHRLIAVLRAPTPEAALGAARACLAGGVAMLEVTYSVPNAPRVMRELAGVPGAIVGAGTVLTERQCHDALEAGATFIIAPNCSPAVGRITREAGAMYCPGAFTTGEIIAAMDAGAHLVKVYPVGVVGGPDYIRVIRDPLPAVPMLAAGGTNLDNLVPFLEAGCLGAGLGAALADPKLATAGAFGEIERRARAFAQRIAGWKVAREATA